MDYFQSVVAEYLQQSLGTMFIKTECPIQVEPGQLLVKGRSWYCDVIAVDLKTNTAYLCEVSYSSSLSPLVKRLRAWSENWEAIRASLERDYSIPKSWHVEPLAFIPEKLHATLKTKLPVGTDDGLGTGAVSMPEPTVKPLELVTPWSYRLWYATPGGAQPKA